MLVSDREGEPGAAVEQPINVVAVTAGEIR
jgi:hypothetical protein